jgi:hypothetical protein
MMLRVSLVAAEPSLNDLLSQVCSPDTLTFLESQGVNMNRTVNTTESTHQEKEPSQTSSDVNESALEETDRSLDVILSNCSKLLVLLEQVQEERIAKGTTLPTTFERQIGKNEH